MGKAILVMAGDHGVVNEEVSAYREVITVEMVRSFLKSGAGINVFARQVDAKVWVVEMVLSRIWTPLHWKKGMRLGEGTGGALAVRIMEGAVRLPKFSIAMCLGSIPPFTKTSKDSLSRFNRTCIS